MTQKPPESAEARKIADQALELWTAGDQVRAELAWKRAAELGSTRSMINLGRNRLDVKDFSGASSWFMKAYKLGDVDAALLLAGTARLQGDDAGEEYWSWRASELGNTAVLVYLARQKATETESFDVGIMRSAADLGDFDACCALSSRYFDRGEYAESIRWGERAITLSSRETDAVKLGSIYGLIGCSHASIGNTEQALESLGTAQSLAPGLSNDSIDGLISSLQELVRMSSAARSILPDNEVASESLTPIEVKGKPMDETPFADKLAELAVIFESEEESDFTSYYNIALPAAYLLHYGFVQSPSEECIRFIEDAWLALADVR